MIREDRIELNDRFIKVFRLLEERGEIIKNDRNGKGLGDFAKKILGNRSYGHIIRAFLNTDDKRVIDYRHARTLCNEYGINESYMMDGIGTPFGFDPPPAPVVQGDQAVGNILFTTTEAFAGPTVDNSFVQEANNYFHIPDLDRSGVPLVAFPISGNSMEPVINDGDIVVCEEITSLSSINDNKIYAVKGNGSVWVKYVQPVTNEKGRTTHLKLISANYLEHDPFTEEVGEYTRLYQVIRRISDLS